MDNVKDFKYTPDLKLCYQLFGKTGHTTILHIFLKLLKDKGIFVDYKKNVHNTTSNYNIICDIKDKKNKEIFLDKNNKFLISIRNPYTRVLSLYLHITRNETKIPGLIWQEKLNYNDKLKNFNHFLKLLSKKGVDNIDNHTFSFNKNSLLKHVNYDYIIRFESFYNDIENMIKKLYNIDIKIPHKGFKSNSNKKVLKHYNKENMLIVKDSLYKNDFDILGYSTDLKDVNELPSIVDPKTHITDFYKQFILGE